MDNLKKEKDSTVAVELPVQPDAEMPDQVSEQRPPIDDTEYTPESSEELVRAAKALAELVSYEKIGWYYNQLKKLRDESLKECDAPKVNESRIRKMIKETLADMLNEHRDDDIAELDSYRDSGIDYFGEREPEPLPASTQVRPADGDYNLEDMAKEFGYSAASGMRQEIHKITKRLNYFVTKVNKEDLVALTDYAAGEYVDSMEAADLLDEESISDLRAAPQAVKQLDSFKFFFVSAFVLPAYREIVREMNSKIEDKMVELDIPMAVRRALFNQVTGAAVRKPMALKAKIDKLVDSGELSPQEGDEAIKKTLMAFAPLSELTELSDDLVQRSLSKWQKASKGKRKAQLIQALEKTIEA